MHLQSQFVLAELYIRFMSNDKEKADKALKLFQAAVDVFEAKLVWRRVTEAYICLLVVVCHARF